jgi:uncharacterized protein YbbC (DUF1343 family)
MIATGLDRLLVAADRLAGRRYGLLAHAAALTADCRPAHLALAASAAGPPAALFAPEHGFHGVEQDMVALPRMAGGREPWTGVAVHSLYGDSEASLRPRPEAFAGLDLLLVDLQDVGARYYTFAATAAWAAEEALAAGCEVWVLDRPNPLGGAVEGNLPAPGYESFVGAFPVPVRHGLTVGELLRLEARRRGWSDGLTVWEARGWRRDGWWAESRSGGPAGRAGLHWAAPSPNMPTPATALVYPGTCLIEATELSEGRGTTRPFQLVGAPWLDPLGLAERLAALDLPGVRFVPTYFRPQFHKHSGELCGGVELVVTDPGSFAPFRTGVELLAAVAVSSPADFAWRRAPYEFVADRPAIDLLAGTDRCRRAIDAGDRGALDAWIDSWPADEETFRRARRAALLYPEAEGEAPS